MTAPTDMLIEYYFTSGTSHFQLNKKSPFICEASFPQHVFTLSDIISTLQEDKIDISIIDSYKYYSEHKNGYIKIDSEKRYPTQKKLKLLLHIQDQHDNELQDIESQIASIENMIELNSSFFHTSHSMQSLASFKYDFISNNNNNNNQLQQTQYTTNQLDLMYLYASPIVKCVKNSNSNSYCEFTEQLDYQGEIDKILNIITESKKAFNAEFKATDFETFIDAIRSYPKILHISSHGVIKENKDKKMFYLCLEKDGCYTEISEERIRAVLQDEKISNIDLVFISACHSEALGKIFYDSGIKSVICVNLMTKISDFAAQLFCSSFYQFLLNGHTISDSFEKSKNIFRDGALQDTLHECCCNHKHNSTCKYIQMSKEQQQQYHMMYHSKICSCSYKEYNIHVINCKFVKRNQLIYNDCMKVIKIENGALIRICCCSPEIPHNESNKFILINNDAYKNYIVFPQLQTGRLTITNSNYFRNCPLYKKRKIPLIGRNIEIKIIMNHFTQHQQQQKKIILIYGRKGIGKKAFAKYTSVYLFERKVIDYVTFINLDSCSRAYETTISQLKHINMNTMSIKKYKALIIISFPSSQEESFIKTLNDIIIEIQMNYNQYLYLLLVDTEYNITDKIEMEMLSALSFQNNSDIIKMKLPPLSKESGECLFNKVISFLSKTKIRTKEEFDYLLNETECYPDEIFYIAYSLQNKIYIDEMQKHFKDRKQDIGRIREEIINSFNSNHIASKVLFLLAVLPKGLCKTQFVLMSSEYWKQVESDTKVIIAMNKEKINENWYKILNGLSSLIISITKEQIKIECIKQAFEMFAKFFMVYIKNNTKYLHKEWNEEIEFNAMNNDSQFWCTFNEQCYLDLFGNLESEYEICAGNPQMRYLNKHKYNIESLIENNKKIIEKLITNDNDIMFIECFEQVMLCLPTVYKMQNRIDECKEILKQYIAICGDYNLNYSQERLRIFLYSLNYDNTFQPVNSFPSVDYALGKAEAFFAKGMLDYNNKETKEKGIQPLIESIKYLKQVNSAKTKLAKAYYFLGQIYIMNPNSSENLLLMGKKYLERGVQQITSADNNNNNNNNADSNSISVNYGVDIKDAITLIINIKCLIGLTKIEMLLQNYEKAFTLISNAFKKAKEIKIEYIINNTNQLLSEIKSKMEQSITLISSNSLLDVHQEPVKSPCNSYYYIIKSFSNKISKKIRIKHVLLTKQNLLNILQTNGEILIIYSDDFTLNGDIVLENEEGNSEILTINEFNQLLIKSVKKISYKVIILAFHNSCEVNSLFVNYNIPFIISFEKFELVMNEFTNCTYISYNMLRTDFVVSFIENCVIYNDTVENAFDKARKQFMLVIERIPELNNISKENESLVKLTINPVSSILPSSLSISQEQSHSHTSHNEDSNNISNNITSANESSVNNNNNTNTSNVNKNMNLCLFNKNTFEDGKVIVNPQLIELHNENSTKRITNRNKDLSLLIHSILEKKIVNLFGVSGVGKTELGYEVAKFFYRHETFKNGIFFTSETKSNQISKLSDMIKGVASINIKKTYNKHNSNNNNNEKVNGFKIKTNLYQYAMKSLENSLIIIDKIDKCVKRAKKQKYKFIDKIPPNIYLLLISREMIHDAQVTCFYLEEIISLRNVNAGCAKGKNNKCF